MTMRKRLALALRMLAKRIDPPLVLEPVAPRETDVLGPEMRKAQAVLATLEQARELLETACAFDPRTRRFILRAEFFPASEKESS
jgi:hypothetical protein